jgi:rubrerythrin
VSGLIDRDYCLRHPGSIVRTFGVGVFLGTIASRRKSLLARAVEYHQLHGCAFPGHVGRAYRLAALIELRVARIYGKLAERFAAQPEVSAFFRTLEEEEQEHSRLMQLCRFLVVRHPRLKYLPEIRHPNIRAILALLRELSVAVDTLPLDKALEATVTLEQGEINSIFDRLLKQADVEPVRLFEGRLHEAEGHADAVPKRVAALRERLASAEAGKRLAT